VNKVERFILILRIVSSTFGVCQKFAVFSSFLYGHFLKFNSYYGCCHYETSVATHCASSVNELCLFWNLFLYSV
jgi:hypothetical protein